MAGENALLITLGLILILSPLLKNVFRRLGTPALVGYILLGFLVSIFDARWAFITSAFGNTFEVLGQLGVVALLFRVGLRSHTSALLAKLPDASLVWVGDVLTNLAVGFLISRYVFDLPFETALIIATAFSATSVGVAVAVWDEAGKLSTTRGQLMLDVAELDDLSGVLLLAVVLAVVPVLQLGDGGLLREVGVTTSAVLLKLSLFITGCYLFAHYLEADFTRVSRKLGGSALALTISILGAGICIATLAGYLGFTLAVGALFAGLAFSRDPDAVRSDANFSYFYEFLTPFFFINIGMQMDPGAFFDSLSLGLILFLAAALAKFAGVALPAMLLMSRRHAITLGISMIPRAEIALVILNQCRQLGDNLISAKVFSGMILVSLISSVVAPILLRRRLGGRSSDAL